MTDPTRAGGSPYDAEEESRYQAAHALDPEKPSQASDLLRHLADPSWRVRAAASERIATHPRPAEVLPTLLEAALAGSSPGSRSAAAAALTRLGPAAVGALLTRLASDRAGERCVAADVLGEIGDRRAALALGDRLGDSDPNVRVSAAEALGKVGGASAVEALLGALAAADASLRVAALDALERLGVAPPLERLAALFEDRAARAPAYRILGLSAEPEALVVLARGTAEMSRSVREAAYLAVARQAETRPEALAPLAAAVRETAGQVPSLVDWATEAIADPGPLVADGAIRVLGWTGHVPSALRIAAAAEEETLRPAVVAALRALGPGIAEALGGAPTRLSTPARVAVFAALARVGDQAAIPELAEASLVADGAVRAQAIEALGGSGHEAAATHLARLLDHPDPEVSGLAAAALADLARAGSRLREEVLLRSRSVAPGRTPAALLRLLGEVGEEEDVELARRALGDPRPATRAAAAQAVGRLAGRKLVRCAPREILGALDDPQPRVRAAAASALGALGAAGAFQPEASGDIAWALSAAIHDEISTVRAAAARAIGSCRIEPLCEALAALMQEGEPEVVSSALHALAELGRADPADLERAVLHADPEVAKEAVRAAALQPSAFAAAILLKGLCHPRWDVRRAAARAAADGGDSSLTEALRDVAGIEEDPLVAEALAEALRALAG